MLTFVLFVLIAATVAIVFLPKMKTSRTVIAARLTVIWGALLPYLSDIFTVLKGADWRTIINPQYAPLVMLLIGIIFEILRRRTAST